MTVLTILGVLLYIAVIVALGSRINAMVYKQYKFDLFDETSIFTYMFAFVIGFFGVISFESALKVNGGDTLNGILMMAIALIIILSHLIYNLKRTPSILVGVGVSVMQLIGYMLITPVILIIFAIAVALVSQTKPVWVINND